MVAILLHVHLQLPGVSSLKEKRRILKSLLTRLRNDFNISIAEVGENDTLQTAIIGAAVVSNSTSYGDQVMAQVVNKIQNESSVFISDYHTETW